MNKIEEVPNRCMGICSSNIISKEDLIRFYHKDCYIIADSIHHYCIKCAIMFYHNREEQLEIIEEDRNKFNIMLIHYKGAK